MPREEAKLHHLLAVFLCTSKYLHTLHFHSDKDQDELVNPSISQKGLAYVHT